MAKATSEMISRDVNQVYDNFTFSFISISNIIFCCDSNRVNRVNNLSLNG